MNCKMSWDPVKWTTAQLLCARLEKKSLILASRWHRAKQAMTKEVIFVCQIPNYEQILLKIFQTSGFRKEARTPKSVSTAFSINEVANKTHSVLFGTPSMLSAVETDSGALASFLKPEVASSRKFLEGWWTGGSGGALV